MTANNADQSIADVTPVISLMKSMILTNKAMMSDAEHMIKQSINPLKREYWRGRRDVYESNIRSCEAFLGIDLLIESSK